MPSEDTTILEFNQCHESDKILFITYANFECLMDVKAIMTTKVTEHQVFQCLQYRHLNIQKISMIYKVVKVAWKSCMNP